MAVQGRETPLRLGSLKSDEGRTQAAAGAAGRPGRAAVFRFAGDAAEAHFSILEEASSRGSGAGVAGNLDPCRGASFKDTAGASPRMEG